MVSNQQRAGKRPESSLGRLAAIAAALVPVLLTIAGQSLGHLAGFALFAAACAPWVGLAVWPRWPHHRWVFAALASLGFVGVGLVTLGWQDFRSLTATKQSAGRVSADSPAPQTPPELAAAAKQLRFLKVAEPVRYCENFTGTGTIPVQDVLVLLERPADADGNPDPGSGYSYDGRAAATSNGWSADQREIGVPTKTAIGAHALITAFLLSEGSADFLDSLPNAFTAPLPASVLSLGAIADQVVVTRGADNTPCNY